jgi:rhamnosyltransferase
MMVELYADYDVYIFLTQDAYLDDHMALDQMLGYFGNERVGAVCGRQLAHLDANALARHARDFNYPATSRVKSFADASALGLKTAFISNSFAAYRRSALEEAGGFPSHVILSEDMYVTAKMLLLGWNVAYAGDACCRHSHNYSTLEEFRRYFDIGVFHAREPWIRRAFGGAGGEGTRYVLSELKFLGWRRCYLWPLSLTRNAVKLAGYKLGLMERWLPLKLKRHLSMHRRYWDGAFASCRAHSG